MCHFKRRWHMTIENRDLPAGARLRATYKKQPYGCRVEREGDGKLAFVLEGGRRFKSPSAAASAVMGGKAVNGWLFWSLTPDQDEAESVSEVPKASKKMRSIYRLPNQKGLAPGKRRWFCTACRKSFIVDALLEPQACPAGHRIDDAEVAVEKAPAQDAL
jgi:hypothetical protein